MNKQSNTNDFKILTTKDISIMLEVGETTAKKYIKDIKEELCIKKVLMIHFKTYFNINV